MSKTVTSLFPSEAEASAVVRRLEEAGISQGEICLFSDTGSDRPWAGSGGHDEGLSGRSPDRVSRYLERNGVPNNDAHAFAEGVRRGHALVAVRCDDDEVDRVIAILDGENTVDMDEQERSWRSEGWTGRDAGPIGAAGNMTTGMTTGLMGGDRDAVGMSGSAAGQDVGRVAGDRDREDVIPVAEEELHVGKREVSHGRVRIHSHVVERPVQEQVTLREETVDVERRPVSGEHRQGTLTGDPFQERTIEVEERDEEAVVSKETRIKEEIAIRKDVEQRTETISDTVRSTEVDVEDERGTRGTGTTGSPDRKR
jgi:uncharacterized protein (TIGR02271 family)